MNDLLLCFAYGSNMLNARMCKRVPSATIRGVAELPGYRLAWHKRSKQGSGKCDIVPEPSSIVFGVVYELLQSEKASLDAAEGLGEGYDEMTVTVLMDGANVDVQVYYATNIDEVLRPFSWYKALVVAGARENGLPPEYIADLECVACTLDSNRARHDRNMRLATGG